MRGELVGRARIVIVGDDQVLLGVLEELLGYEGYEVNSALRRAEGYVLVSERRPDLVIVDLTFSGRHDGLGLLAELRRDPDLLTTPVMVCSALPVDLLEAPTAHEPVPTVLKPFELEELLETVRALLNGKDAGVPTSEGGAPAPAY